MNTLREARLRRDLNNVAGQVQSLLEHLGDEGSARLESLRDRMSATASDVSATAREKLAPLGSGARQAAQATDGFVRENPWRVVGLVALAGLVVGYFASRR